MILTGSEKREALIRIVLPFKDQKSAKAVIGQLGDLRRKINPDISPDKDGGEKRKQLLVTQ